MQLLKNGIRPFVFRHIQISDWMWSFLFSQRNKNSIQPASWCASYWFYRMQSFKFRSTAYSSETSRSSYLKGKGRTSSLISNFRDADSLIIEQILPDEFVLLKIWQRNFFTAYSSTPSLGTMYLFLDILKPKRKMKRWDDT